MGQLPLEDLLADGVEEAELAGTEALAEPVGLEPPPEEDWEPDWEGWLPPPDGAGVADPEGWAPPLPPPPEGAGADWEG